ncbi:hypothetical protein LTR04_003356, partial [Oleoguttula sp. CCFEE 6159]
LATQMYASIKYIQLHHSYGTIPSQPSQDPHPATDPTAANSNPSAAQEAASANEPPNPNAPPPEPIPDTPEVFQAALRELARDLIVKEQQIEYLIGVLPGIGTSEKEQEARLRELEQQMREVEAERLQCLEKKERLVERVSQAVMRCRRV